MRNKSGIILVCVAHWETSNNFRQNGAGKGRFASGWNVKRCPRTRICALYNNISLPSNLKMYPYITLLSPEMTTSEQKNTTITVIWELLLHETQLQLKV